MQVYIYTLPRPYKAWLHLFIVWAYKFCIETIVKLNTRHVIFYKAIALPWIEDLLAFDVDLVVNQFNFCFLLFMTNMLPHKIT